MDYSKACNFFWQHPEQGGQPLTQLQAVNAWFSNKEGSHLTNYRQLMPDLATNENGKKFYQGVQLTHFQRPKCNVSIIYPVLQTFAQTLRKGLVTSTSQQSWKTLNPYSTLSLGLLTEIVVFFLTMMPSKKSISILWTFLLRTATISQKFLVSGLS